MALAAITPGAAARILSLGQPPLKFIEQVEYNGRRLAKLNLPPSAILEALEEYDQILSPVLETLNPDENSNFQWVREQLHFCVILTLNNAYYQVREAETQAFYELFRVELESRNLDELLRRFLDSLVHVCRADAGRLYMLNDESTAWDLKAGTPNAVDLSVANQPGLIKKLSKPRHLSGEALNSSVMLDGTWHQRFSSCWSIPLAADGRTAGVMQFGFTKPYEWLPREQELLAAAAERCLMAAEKARLMEDLAQREEQVRRLAEHMLHVEEMERRRISRELHDEAGQSLLCIRLQIELIEQALPESEHEWRGKLREARDLTERTILEMRRLISALSPGGAGTIGVRRRAATAGQPLSTPANVPGEAPTFENGRAAATARNHFLPPGAGVFQQHRKTLLRHQCKHFARIRRWKAKAHRGGQRCRLQRAGGASQTRVVRLVRHAGASSTIGRRVLCGKPYGRHQEGYKDFHRTADSKIRANHLR